MEDILVELKKRRNITKTYDTLDIYDMDGDLKELIDRLSGILEGATEDGATRIYCIADTDFSDNDDGYAQLLVRVERPETDAEIDARIDMYNKAELAKYLKEQENLKKEKEQYLVLKQKYQNELG